MRHALSRAYMKHTITYGVIGQLSKLPSNLTDCHRGNVMLGLSAD